MDGPPIPSLGDDPVANILVFAHVDWCLRVTQMLTDRKIVSVERAEKELMAHAALLRTTGEGSLMAGPADALANGIEVMAMILAGKPPPTA